MPSQSDALTLRCGDCGLHADIPSAEAESMLASLHAFLAKHAECSYDVSLVALPG